MDLFVALCFSSNAIHVSRKAAWQTASIGNLSACLTVLCGARHNVYRRPGSTHWEVDVGSLPFVSPGYASSVQLLEAKVSLDVCLNN